jgi:uncharacterized membrane protein YeaQ/YmgE (transglycosylase-associated protein family)
VTILVWLAIGAAVGLAAAFVHRLTGIWHRLLNLLAGLAGAIGGGIAEGRGSVDAEPFETNALIVAACGAVILVGILNLFLRRAEGDSHS